MGSFWITFLSIFFVRLIMNVFLFVVKKVFIGKDITPSIKHSSIINFRKFLSCWRFKIPSGITINAFPPGFNALIIHSTKRPSTPSALILKCFSKTTSFLISSFKLLLPLVTYGGLVRIRSYSFSIGSDNVPNIEFVFKIKLSLNIFENCSVIPGFSFIKSEK